MQRSCEPFGLFESFSSFVAVEPQFPSIYLSPQAQAIFGPPELLIRACKIALHNELGFVGQTPEELQYSAKQKRALDEVISELEDVFKRVHRVFGPSHSYSKELSGKLDRLRNLRREHAHRFQST